MSGKHLDLASYLEERIVLTTKNEVCYAGVASRELTVDGRRGLMVTIDQKSGFRIWCPEDFIKNVLVIPIPKEDNQK